MTTQKLNFADLKSLVEIEKRPVTLVDYTTKNVDFELRNYALRIIYHLLFNKNGTMIIISKEKQAVIGGMKRQTQSKQ